MTLPPHQGDDFRGVPFGNRRKNRTPLQMLDVASPIAVGGSNADNNLIDSRNSTAEALGSSESFTGAATDVLPYAETTIALYAEPSNASGTLYFEYSQDGENFDVSIPVTVSNPTIQVPIPLRTAAAFFRARYVNDSTAQTAFRMQVLHHRTGAKTITRALDTAILTTEPVEVVRAVLTGQDPDGAFSNMKAGSGSSLITSDLLTQVALGNVSGHELITKFGRNNNIDTTTDPEDIWRGGGLYTGMPIHSASAETVEVFSSATTDDDGDDGANTVRLEGVAGDWTFQTVDVTMNGQTAVPTTETWHRVNRAYVLTAGASETNDGDITIRHTSTTANIFAVIPAGKGQTQIAAYTIPDGKTGYLTRVNASIARSSGAAGSGNFDFMVRE